jgi:hypothetical protein
MKNEKWRTRGGGGNEPVIIREKMTQQAGEECRSELIRFQFFIFNFSFFIFM